MIIREKAMQRRMQAKEKIEVELQREVDRFDEFLEQLQKEDISTPEFVFHIYESGADALEARYEKKGVQYYKKGDPNFYFNLKNQTMSSKEFVIFLMERLKGEGAEFNQAVNAVGIDGTRMVISLL